MKVKRISARYPIYWSSPKNKKEETPFKKQLVNLFLKIMNRR